MTALDHKNIRDAARIIRDGGVIAMPTETVYGLAADATNDTAVARIFEAKGRPQFNPLIIHVSGVEMARAFVEVSPLAQKLMAEFWPGPLTLVLPRKKDSNLSLLVSAGLDTVGVRMPKHDLAQALIKAADRPLAAPSANRSGTISPTRADHVKDGLGERVDMILDGGPCPVGVESTIVKVENDRVTLLRPGGIAREAIERSAGQALSSAHGKIEAPGMMTSHYAPDAKIRLNAQEQREGEAFLGFGEIEGAGPSSLNLSKSGDLAEAAANLFAYLREADLAAKTHGLKTIAVAPIPMEGLGEAINDRLARAAAPRD
ncbi:L-threonylcarbamoyladenylate synthase [Marinicaulis aureus]|uniref:Threonylcarbamoyl-AMP synthase n=1 Tax=Hyphococcus aureus TaxID=2666033 RepID=A0ABW1KZ47_9PROT